METEFRKVSRSLAGWLRFGIALLLAVLTVSAVAASPEASAQASRAKVRNVLQDWMMRVIDEVGAPGVVMVAADPGGTFHQITMGLSDLDAAKPISFETPLRVGSLSKVMTGAVLLEAERRGEIDLGRTLGTFHGEAYRGLPADATLRQLLAHTGGIGERFVGGTVTDSADLEPHGDFLQSEPAPLFDWEPGTNLVYSNYGISHAAQAFAAPTGTPFADSAEAMLFAPLGMQSTTFQWPSARDADVARGYNTVIGMYREMPFRHWKPYPASSLITTGRDMARLLEAIAQHDDHAAAFHAMMQPRYRVAEDVDGIGTVLWQSTRHGVEMWWHTGHMPGHRSLFAYFPEFRIGVFVNYNHDTKVVIEIAEALQAALAEITPADSSGPEPDLSGFAAVEPKTYGTLTDAQAGTYRHTWYPTKTFGKTAVFMNRSGQTVRVSDVTDDGIRLDGVRYSRIADGRYLQASTEKVIAFYTGGTSATPHLTWGGHETYHRIGPLEGRGVHICLLIACGLMFTITAHVGIILFAANARHWNDSEKRAELILAASAALASNLLAGGILLLFWVTFEGAYAMLQEVPVLLVVALWCFAVGLFSGVVFIASLILSWTRQPPRLLDAVHHIPFAISILAFAAYASYWKLMPWHLG